jgi:hypothetical protein
MNNEVRGQPTLALYLATLTPKIGLLSVHYRTNRRMTPNWYVQRIRLANRMVDIDPDEAASVGLAGFDPDSWS